VNLETILNTAINWHLL